MTKLMAKKEDLDGEKKKILMVNKRILMVKRGILMVKKRILMVKKRIKSANRDCSLAQECKQPEPQEASPKT